MRVMSTANDPNAFTSVKRRQKDGTRIAIPCPESIKLHCVPTSRIKTIKQFRMELARELIGNYCSRRLPGCRPAAVRPLPLQHFPVRNQQGKRCRCRVCSNKKKHTDTTWYCQVCNQWLCHNRNPTSDCYLVWHKRVVDNEH